MSGSFELDEIAEIASCTGLSQKEILEIIELVGPNRSSVIREATILKREMAKSEVQHARDMP
ncbi:MAG: hypothetical protein QM744_13245 [Mesorhizobium sp.]